MIVLKLVNKKYRVPSKKSANDFDILLTINVINKFHMV
jgi:hypothetical protein